MKELKLPPADFALPAGFALVPKRKDGPALELVAQDAEFNTAGITLTAVSVRNMAGQKMPALHDRVKAWTEGWAKAVETKRGGMPKKAKPMKLGNVKADGMQLKGKLGGFPVTQRVLFKVQDGWILELSVVTYGKGDRVFAAGIQTFMKKFHLRDK